MRIRDENIVRRVLRKSLLFIAESKMFLKSQNFRSLWTVQSKTMSAENVDYFVTSASSVTLYEVKKGDVRWSLSRT